MTKMDLSQRDQQLVRSALRRQLKIRTKAVERAVALGKPAAAHQSQRDAIDLRGLIKRFEQALSRGED